MIKNVKEQALGKTCILRETCWAIDLLGVSVSEVRLPEAGNGRDSGNVAVSANFHRDTRRWAGIGCYKRYFRSFTDMVPMQVRPTQSSRVDRGVEKVPKAIQFKQ